MHMLLFIAYSMCAPNKRAKAHFREVFLSFLFFFFRITSDFSGKPG